VSYWPQHHSGTADLGGFSYDHGFHYDYDSRGPDGSGYKVARALSRALRQSARGRLRACIH
jgi:hypothetical protein